MPLQVLRPQFSVAQLLGVVTVAAVLLGIWHIWTGPERTAALVRKLGGEVEWITEGGLNKMTDEPLPASERYSRVVIGSDWRGGRKGLVLLHSIRRMRELEIKKSSEIASLVDVKVNSLTNLRVLKIDGLSVPAETTLQLSTMTALEEANFVDCEVDGEVVAVTTELPMLHDLVLADCRLKGHIRAARQSTVYYIYLSGTLLADGDMDWLASLTHAGTIVLSDSNLNDHGLWRLCPLPLIESISVARTHVTTAGIEEFRRRAVRPECFLYYGQDLSRVDNSSKQIDWKKMEDIHPERACGVKSQNRRHPFSAGKNGKDRESPD